MNIDELIKENRTFRRFYQDETVSVSTLKDLVNLGRLSASSGNLQPLKYIICNEKKLNEEIFQCLGWGYPRDWMGEREKPSAYIVILGDTKISRHYSCDHGIAAQSILLGAKERGLGGCMVGALKRDDLSVLLSIPPEFVILLVLALGKPKHKVVITEISADEKVKYWKDEDGVHYVPKRKLEDIIVSAFLDSD